MGSTRPNTRAARNLWLEKPVNHRSHQFVADFFRIHAGAIKAPQVVNFLKILERHTRQPMLIVFDGAPIHRSKLVAEHVASTKGRILIERLPAYAPELNPAEYIWAHLKEHAIANLLVKEAWQLSHHATAALRKMRRRPWIIRACFAHSELWPE